jgi:hypothetical protein
MKGTIAMVMKQHLAGVSRGLSATEALKNVRITVRKSRPHQIPRALAAPSYLSFWQSAARNDPFVSGIVLGELFFGALLLLVVLVSFLT